MKEAEIRPAELMQRYLELSRDDSVTLLGDAGEREPCACPACGSHEARPAFEKHGFTYVECMACRSLYVTPRPTAEALDRFYMDSPSSRFWAQEFFPAVAEARRLKLVRPKVKRILSATRERLEQVDRPVVVDVGAGAGTFLEEVGAALPPAELVAVEPGRDLAEACRAVGVRVVEAPVEDARELESSGDLVTSFEVLEHVHDPLSFVAAMARIAKPGGTVLVTGLCGDGLDVQVLGAAANAVSPPHHLNFLSVHGLERMFERAGLEAVEVETPGELDVELVRRAVEEGRAPALPRFLDLLLTRRDERVWAAFQRFLQDARLSSHTWIWARRPL